MISKCQSQNYSHDDDVIQKFCHRLAVSHQQYVQFQLASLCMAFFKSVMYVVLILSEHCWCSYLTNNITFLVVNILTVCSISLCFSSAECSFSVLCV